MQKITNHLKFNVRSLLELMVLKLLSDKTYSPAEIYEALKNIGFKTPMGTLYPLLGSLVTEKLLIKGIEESESGGRLKTYALTEKGRARLTDLRGDWKRLSSAIASL